MSLIRRIVHHAASLVPRGLQHQLRNSLGIPSADASLVRMKKCGFRPAVVIDVGAYRGEWTVLCKRIFPTARVLMIEPQSTRQHDLARVKVSHPDVEIAPALLGAAEKTAVDFYECDSASSVLGETAHTTAPSTTLPMRTLDGITAETPFARPDLIKLDVQGYELEVLSGGADTLASAEAVLTEVNLIEIYRDAPLFHQVAAFMAQRGFRVYDICTFFRRPYDGAVWQMDVIFVKSSSPLIASKRWS